MTPPLFSDILKESLDEWAGANKDEMVGVKINALGKTKTVNEMDSSIMSARQLVQTHNDYFSSLSFKLCTEVNKDIIIISKNSQWYDASIVNLRHQRRRAKHR